MGFGLKRVYITFTNRVENEGDSPEDRGEAVVVDWETKQVIHALDVFGSEPVERGRSRGASGICWLNGEIFVACRTGISVFDPETFDLKRSIPCAGVSGIHQIDSNSGKIHVVSSEGNFSIIDNQGIGEKINLCQSDYREDVIRSMQGHAKGKLDWEYGPLHFNSIAWNPKTDDEYHLYMSGGIIFNWTKKEMVYALKNGSSHDLLFLDEYQVLVNDSSGGKLLLVDLMNKHHREVFKTSSWLRGLARHQDSLFVSSSPGTLYELDSNNFSLRGELKLPISNTQQCPYGILLDPRDWR